MELRDIYDSITGCSFFELIFKLYDEFDNKDKVILSEKRFKKDWLDTECDENLFKVIVYCVCHRKNKIYNHNYLLVAVNNHRYEDSYDYFCSQYENNLYIRSLAEKWNNKEIVIWIKYKQFGPNNYLVLGCLRSSRRFKYIVTHIEDLSALSFTNHSIKKCFGTMTFETFEEAEKFYQKQLLI